MFTSVNTVLSFDFIIDQIDDRHSKIEMQLGGSLFRTFDLCSTYMDSRYVEAIFYPAYSFELQNGNEVILIGYIIVTLC